MGPGTGGSDTGRPISERTRRVIGEVTAAGTLPAVTLSWAQSRDGAIAAAGGVRTPLSCPESLALTHALRALHGAILVGIGTVLSDDPLLSVRLAPGPQPQTVVLDSHLRLPLGSRLLARRDVKPWIFCAPQPAGTGSEDLRERAGALEAAGARVFPVARRGAGLDLAEVLAALGREGIGSLMVEGGAHVLRAFLSSRLASQAVVTVCPFPLEGLRVLEDSADAERLPGLAGEVREIHGRDTVVWGRIRTP
jgi:riboflavin-specific deaminase-like protein